ncbi:MAG: DUF3048 domain-containing protein [Clostridia bacterium]|nr:DUF3048 domain-containing protein [Clostridia bacterium]
MKSRVWLSVLLALSLLLGLLSGCAGAPADNGGAANSSEQASPSSEQERKVTPGTGAKNPLTGLDDMGGSTNRPVGVMIANNDFMQGEQVGIADADMWMETETEAGITRIMAVFANTARVPSSIGPIRSARSPFVHVVDALDFAYAHAGGSAPALDLLSSVDGVGNIDLDAENVSDYCWRDENYPHDYEFRLRTSGDMLTKFMRDHDYSQTALKEIPWTFGTPTGDDCRHIGIRMSDAQTIAFDYDSASGSYSKYNGSDNILHCDINGKPLQTENIIILYTDRFEESDITIDFYLQSGTGYVFSKGLTRQFEWERTDDGFIMTEESGGKLTLTPGRVYLCVVATHFEDDLSRG